MQLRLENVLGTNCSQGNKILYVAFVEVFEVHEINLQ